MRFFFVSHSLATAKKSEGGDAERWPRAPAIFMSATRIASRIRLDISSLTCASYPLVASHRQSRVTLATRRAFPVPVPTSRDPREDEVGGAPRAFVPRDCGGGGNRRATSVNAREAPGVSLRVETQMRLDFLSENSQFNVCIESHREYRATPRPGRLHCWSRHRLAPHPRARQRRGLAH